MIVDWSFFLEHTWCDELSIHSNGEKEESRDCDIEGVNIMVRQGSILVNQGIKIRAIGAWEYSEDMSSYIAYSGANPLAPSVYSHRVNNGTDAEVLKLYTNHFQKRNNPLSIIRCPVCWTFLERVEHSLYHWVSLLTVAPGSSFALEFCAIDGTLEVQLTTHTDFLVRIHLQPHVRVTRTGSLPSWWYAGFKKHDE